MIFEEVLVKSSFALCVAALMLANIASALCFIDDKIDRKAIDKLGKDGIDKLGAVKWIGTDEKFFLLAAIPYPESPPRERRCASGWSAAR